ncbi:MAG: hypothetical protein P1P84_02640 [Deferrisomatales bacterium]|nr:hypothetical protein [Deferrisomatales bacterium]
MPTWMWDTGAGGVRLKETEGEAQERVAVDEQRQEDKKFLKDEARQDAIEGRTELEKQTTAIAGEQWNRYATVFRPFEDKVMADVANNDRYATQVQGAINANIMQKQAGTGTVAQAYGNRAGAITDASAMGAEGVAQTAARGSVEGTNALAAEGSAMMQNVVELGRGGADFAVSGLGQAASLATQQTISDWGFQFGLDKLDVQQQMNNSELNSAQYIQNQNYLTSLFASATGAGAYGVEQGWFSPAASDPVTMKA